MPKPEKTAPLGICDYCGRGIASHEWWTSKGKPRLHCSIECRQAANSRKMENRSEWMRQRIDDGEWVNPASINKPSPEKLSKAARSTRLREVREGRWRNPGQTDEAKAINTLPHKYSGALANALEKIRLGTKLKDLSLEEYEAHRVYRHELRNARKNEINQWYRDYYRKRQSEMTDEEREAQRQKWRENNKKRKK